jgi:hypothetical protein
VTRRADEGFADPDYEIAIDWLGAREAILQAQRMHDDGNRPPRILLINGSPRSEHTCSRQTTLRREARSGILDFSPLLPLARRSLSLTPAAFIRLEIVE